MIVGSGIAGFVLAFELFKKKVPFFIVSDSKKTPASAAAGALLNYFNASKNKIAEDDFFNFPKALTWYQEAEMFFQEKILHAYPLKYKNTQDVISIHQPCFWLDIRTLLRLFESFFAGQIIKSKLMSQDLNWQNDHVIVQGQAYSQIIFCTGAQARYDPLWSHIPFTANRGEALILRIPEANFQEVLQIEHSKLIPLNQDLYWFGARHLWTFSDLEPDSEWASRQLKLLESHTGIQAQLVEHLCAERPTTAGQRVFLEFHPEHHNAAIITGLGSKGILRAPALIPTFVADCIFAQP